ncbi:hypothetical protein [Burkholderia stagnalis]|uniref:hypothetical protein n=1 Tax=Burkholderia stagnalis TaxID=1503054 RepID=UPI000A8D3409
MTRSMYLRAAAACVALALGVVATAAHAHDGNAGSDNVRPVMKQAVPEAPGKLAVVASRLRARPGVRAASASRVAQCKRCSRSKRS